MTATKSIRFRLFFTTEFYTVLTTGGFNLPTPIRSTKKIKRRVGKFNTYKNE